MINKNYFSNTEHLIILLSKYYIESDDIQTAKKIIEKNSQLTDFISIINNHGVASLIYQNLNKYFSEIFPPNILNELKRIYEKTSINNINKVKELIIIENLFRESGIESIYFKGPLLSQQLYDDITLRPFSDIDIIVRKKDITKINDILLSNNYEPQFILNKQYKELYINNWYYYNYSSVGKANNMDIHWSTDNSEYSFSINFEDIEEFTIQKEIYGFKLKTLKPEILLTILCQHGSKHAWKKLNWISDINTLIAANKLDWSEVFDFAIKYNSEKMLLTGLVVSKLIYKTQLPEMVSNKLNKDKTAISNANYVLRNLFGNNKEDNILFHLSKDNQFYLKTMTNPLDKIHILLSPLKVTPLEWELNLPISLYFLYYLYRPYRIIKKKYFAN